MQASLLLVANPTISPAGKFLERNYYWLEIMARLRPGVTLAQAQAGSTRCAANSPNRCTC